MDNTVVVDALVSIAGVYLMALGTFLIKWLNKRATATEVDVAKILVQSAVKATDQISGRLGIDKEAKYDEALQRVKDLAEAHGIHKTDQQWGTLIEDAVDDMRRWWDAAKGHEDENAPEPATSDVPDVPDVPEDAPIASPENASA